MVSIRKRRHAALLLERQVSKLGVNREMVEPRVQKVESSLSQQGCSTPTYDPQLQPAFEGALELSAFSVSSSSKDELKTMNHERELKRRKRQRRKYLENQEPCMMRGVYFKNMKWQAAIKVEKKQIHLGTVPTMEEAAHLYDRAAYMCGREPNFELPEDEKRTLQGLQWEEFLALTRRAIANKKRQKKIDSGMRRKLGSSTGVKPAS
eukprot:c27835_g1_i4 orf=1416-2036(+)